MSPPAPTLSVIVPVHNAEPFLARTLQSVLGQGYPRLELIVVSRGGPVNVNLEAATERGIAVCYAPGRNAQAAAEFTIGMMLAACRNIAGGHEAMRHKAWPSRYFVYENAGLELDGARIGLVGYGAIGKIVARIVLRPELFREETARG